MKALFFLWGRILLLRFRAEDLSFSRKHLLLGLLGCWVVGMGRYWDHSEASLFQMMGLGSVVYVFVLSLFLWLFVWPLRPAAWSYSHLLTFIALSSAPGIIYAIPVEAFFSEEIAVRVNVNFLGVVAIWRVLLLGRYLWVRAELRGARFFVSLLMPLMVLIGVLAALNLEKAVFDFMAGNSEVEPTAADWRYEILVIVSLLSMLGSPLFFLVYVWEIFKVWRQRDPV